MLLHSIICLGAIGKNQKKTSNIHMKKPKWLAHTDYNFTFNFVSGHIGGDKHTLHYCLLDNQPE